MPQLLLLATLTGAQASWFSSETQIEAKLDLVQSTNALLKAQLDLVQSTNAQLTARIEALEQKLAKQPDCSAQEDKFERLLLALDPSPKRAAPPAELSQLHGRKLDDDDIPASIRISSDDASIFLGSEAHEAVTLSRAHSSSDTFQSGAHAALSTGMAVSGNISLIGSSTLAWTATNGSPRTVRELEAEVQALRAASSWSGYKSEVALATSICHGGVSNGAGSMLSIITVPYDFANSRETSSYGDNINSECHTEVNGGWNACGIVKDFYQGQGCANDFGGSFGNYDNHKGSYSTYVPRSTVESGSWSDGSATCTSTSVWICCSPAC